MISFIIGLFVGSFIGVALMALLAMAKDAEPKKHEPEQKEPTILWAVGNICKWKGMMFEIKTFCATKSNQTVAVIERDDPEFHYSVCVPIEELEAVE